MWLRRMGALGGLSVAVTMAIVIAGCGGGSSHKVSSGQGSVSTAGGARTSAGSTTTGATGPPNGIAAKPAAQIVTAASRAIQSARSVHVVGSVTDNGIQVHLNLRLSRGHGGVGQVSENGLSFQLISTGRVLYILGSNAFWTHFGGANAAKLFRGKWLKAPDAGQFGTLGRLATTQGLVGQLLSRHGRVSRAGPATVDGRPAVGVVDRTQGGTLFVATTGPPYPLEIVKRGPNGGYVKFAGFGQPVTITAPTKTISLPSAG